MFVFGSKARTVSRRTRPIARSTRTGKRVDRVSVRNRGGKTTTYYVAVGFNSGKRLPLLNATYTLQVR